MTGLGNSKVHLKDLRQRSLTLQHNSMRTRTPRPQPNQPYLWCVRDTHKTHKVSIKRELRKENDRDLKS